MIERLAFLIDCHALLQDPDLRGVPCRPVLRLHPLRPMLVLILSTAAISSALRKDPLLTPNTTNRGPNLRHRTAGSSTEHHGLFSRDGKARCLLIRNFGDGSTYAPLLEERGYALQPQVQPGILPTVFVEDGDLRFIPLSS